MIYTFILISLTSISTADAFQHRLDQSGLERSRSLLQKVQPLSKEHNIPVHYIMGILYNESNLINRIGDRGYAYSIAQIRCSRVSHRFSWLPYLNKNGFDLTRCRELMLEGTALRAMMVILNHHYEREQDWKKTVYAYHLGQGWRKDAPRAKRYYKKVRFFGSKIVEYNQKRDLAEKLIMPANLALRLFRTVIGKINDICL